MDGDAIDYHSGARADAPASASTTDNDVGITIVVVMPPDCELCDTDTLAQALSYPSTPAASHRCSGTLKGSLLLDTSRSLCLPSMRQMSTQMKKAQSAP
jgi:hypothetical protein